MGKLTTIPRRGFLRTAGASIGALTLGSTAVSADSTERFVVDSRSLGNERDVEVVHDLRQVGLLVVEASEEALGDARYTYDRRYAPGLPGPGTGRTDRVEYPAEGEDLTPYQWDKQDQRIAETHEVTRGEGTVVAIIDSGIGAGHPDLEGTVDASRSKNFTPDSHGTLGPYGGPHGTHVAGIVAASDQTETGVVGSAPGTTLLDLRVFSDTDSAGFSAWMGDVLAAIVHAADVGADVANLSLGWTFLFRDGWGPIWGQAMQRTATYANRKGTVLAHASGNWGGTLQFDRDQRDSSEMSGGLTVSATGPLGFEWGDPGLEAPPHTPAFYTNYGTNAIDIGAPGGNYDFDAPSDAAAYRDLVVSSVAIPEFSEEGDYLGVTYGYDWYAGTSMATPQVVGAAALVKSANPRYNANQVKNALTRTADVPEEYEKMFYGSGYLDTYAAVTQ
jgi:subtilisin family serine protease